MKRGPKIHTREFPRAPSNIIHAKDDAIKTNCWCEKCALMVPRQRVLDGRTGSCGRPNCAEPAQQMSA